MNWGGAGSALKKGGRSNRGVVFGLHALLVSGVCGAYALEIGSLGFKAFTAGTLILSMILLGWSVRYIVKRKGLSPLPKPFKIIFLLIIIWGVVVVVRSIEFEFKVLTDLFGIPSTGMAWVIPILLVVGLNENIWQSLLNIFTFHTLIGVVVFPVFFFMFNYNKMSPEFLNWSLLYASGFILLMYRHQKLWVSIIAGFGLIAFCLNAAMMGRRFMLIVGAIYLFLFVIIFFLKERRWSVKYTVAIVTLCVLFSLKGILGLIDVTESFSSKFQYGYSLLKDKGFSDSRSWIIDDFFNSLSGTDFLFGRGALGDYNSIAINKRLEWGSDRKDVEIGYLQLILKGGVVMLILFMLISFPACWFGLFLSNNSLTLAAGCVVLNRLIEMFIFGLPSANGGYVLFWLAIGACLNPRLRKMKDDELSRLIRPAGNPMFFVKIKSKQKFHSQILPHTT